MSIIQKIRSFLIYYYKAKTHYQIHSPYVSDFINNTLQDDRHYYIFEEIKELRSEVRKNKKVLHIEDFGAGKDRHETVQGIYHTAVSSRAKSELLFKIAKHIKPKSIIELGTSLGINTIYLSHAASQQPIFTFEGAPEIAQQALEHFNQMNCGNINIIEGSFDRTFKKFLDQRDYIDMVYLDGNHQKEPTLRYFEACLPKVHSESILVFDDIHWSTEMEEAWSIIKHHPRVTSTINLYQFGICLFSNNFSEKCEYTLIPYRFKPWQLGFFKSK